MFLVCPNDKSHYVVTILMKRPSDVEAVSRPSGWFDPTNVLDEGGGSQVAAKEDGSYLCVSPLHSPLNSQLSKSNNATMTTSNPLLRLVTTSLLATY